MRRVVACARNFVQESEIEKSVVKEGEEEAYHGLKPPQLRPIIHRFSVYIDSET